MSDVARTSRCAGLCFAALHTYSHLVLFPSEKADSILSVLYTRKQRFVWIQQEYSQLLRHIPVCVCAQDPFGRSREERQEGAPGPKRQRKPCRGRSRLCTF